MQTQDLGQSPPPRWLKVAFSSLCRRVTYLRYVNAGQSCLRCPRSLGPPFRNLSSLKNPGFASYSIKKILGTPFCSAGGALRSFPFLGFPLSPSDSRQASSPRWVLLRFRGSRQN